MHNIYEGLRQLKEKISKYSRLGALMLGRILKSGILSYPRMLGFRHLFGLRPFLPIGGTILLLIVFGKISAYAEVSQLRSGILLASAADASRIVSELDTYTPYLEESTAAVYAHFNSSEEVVSAKPVSPSDRAQLPVAYTTYTIQPGDNISSIADKFNIHVATILEANKLAPEQIENLKAGQELKIASTDTSTSQDWLVALNKKKEQERLERTRRLAVASRGVVTRERIPDSVDGDGNASFAFPLARGGYRGTSRRLTRSHDGVDLLAETGTAVYAAAAGTVIELTGGWGGGFGRSVLISHGGGLTSRYAHLNSISVGVGQTVGQGEVIGGAGNTGNSTGPHLHFETRRYGREFDPGV